MHQTINLGRGILRAELYENTEALIKSALEVISEYQRVMKWARLEFPGMFDH